MDKPLVSVCTPVYNGEKHMHTIIGSFLSQTFKQAEMVIVDNWSTDSTCEIVEHYIEKYPGKIRLLHTDKHYDYPAKGRYQAVLNARADYIFMCDADDEIDCRALEKLYNAAMSYKGGADIVVGSADCIRAKPSGELYSSPYKVFKDQVYSVAEACCTGPEFWNKIIRKDLFIKCGEIPEFVFDDASYIPGLISYAKSIVGIKDVVYYYKRTDDGLSANGAGDLRLTLQAIDAEKHLLANHNPKYTKYIQKYVAYRLSYNIDSKWMFMDYYIDELNEYAAMFLSTGIINSNLMNKFSGLLKITGGHIPNIIYLNGFTHDYNKEEIADIHDRALTHDCEMIVLTSSDADEIAEKMIDDGNMRGACQYLAIKKICETGGYFIDDCVIINNTLNFCRCFGSFVGLENSTEYNDHVFGAQPGNEMFMRVLDTYHSKYLYGQYTLGQRFRLILTSEYEVPAEQNSPKAKYIDNRMAILPENYLTLSGFGRNICEIDYSQLETDDLVLMRRSTFESMLVKNREAHKSVASNTKAEAKLNEIYNSNTWKIVMKLRKIGDGPFGPFLKKIYRFLTKHKNK